MAQCEMCGKDSKLVDAIVEGTMLAVCKNCAKYGNVIAIKKFEKEKDLAPRTLKIERSMPIEKEMEIIKAEYPFLIKNAREKKGLKQEELAQNIAEKASIIHKIESGAFEPPFDLAKKLEQFLRIKLITKTKTLVDKKELNINDSGLTIGDLLNLKKITPK
ncbi:MAG: multiprotein bridging factor aMBF1 [Nanoarchaeota archaeon]|nr:multiprotein bridging factor aMBF1 [Nanoarchaeota archaeon]